MAPPANFDPMHIPRACGTITPSIRTARCKRAFNVVSAQEEEKRAEEAYQKKYAEKSYRQMRFAGGSEISYIREREIRPAIRVKIFQDFSKYRIDSKFAPNRYIILRYRLKIPIFIPDMDF